MRGQEPSTSFARSDDQPHPPQENIFGCGMGWHILRVGLPMGVVSLGMGFWARNLCREMKGQVLEGQVLEGQVLG